MKDVSVFIVKVGSFYVFDVSIDVEVIDLDSRKYYEFGTLHDAKIVATKVGGEIIEKTTTYTHI